MAKKRNNPMQDSGAPKAYPRFNQPIQLKSGVSQKLYRRQFEIINRLIYNIGIMTRIAGNQISSGEFAERANELADMANRELDNILGSCENDMTTEITRMQKLIEENGISEIADQMSFPDAATVTAGLLHPNTNKYLKLFQVYDELQNVLRICWFGQILNEKQMLMGEYRWENRIKKCGTRIRQLAGTVKNGVKRMGQDEAEVEMDAKMIDVPEEESSRKKAAAVA